MSKRRNYIKRNYCVLLAKHLNVNLMYVELQSLPILSVDTLSIF